MSDTTSSPFISDTAGSFAEGDQAQATSSVGETTDWLSTTRQVLRAGARLGSAYGNYDEDGRQITSPDALVAPDVLNDKYGVPGKLKFDSPQTEPVAQSMYNTKRDELMREDAQQRRPAGLLSGAATFGVQAIADALDPTFLAASVVPTLPEVGFGASIGARMAGRAVTGAGSGLLGVAPLTALKYGLSRQEQSDYDAYNAMSDLAVGAGLGAILHVGGGMLGDYLTAKTKNSDYWGAIENSAEAREGTIKTSAAQILRDDAVEARPTLDAAIAENPAWAAAEARREAAGRGLPGEPTEMEPGGQAPFPDGEGLPPEDIGEPPTRITEPPVSEGGGTPGATPFTRLPREPQRLTSYLQAMGGVRDDGGDVLAIIGDHRSRPGLINSRGVSLDEAAERAWHDGYFPELGEQRPTTAELLAKLDDDLKTAPQYSHHAGVSAQAYRDAVAHNSEIDRLVSEMGLSTKGLTLEQFFDAVANHLSEDDFDKRIGDAERAHEAAFRQAQEMARGREETEGTVRAGAEEAGGPGPVSGGEGTVQGGIGPRRGGPGVAGRAETEGNGLGDALRAADGDKPRTRADDAADVAAKAKPDAALKQAEAEIADHEEFFARAEAAGNRTEFTTSKGSTYEVHEDGTTIRDKSYHPEHGVEDQGLKARSERTIYVDKDAASALSGAGVIGADEKGFRLILKDGKASLLSWNKEADRWGVAPSSKDIAFTERPEVGKAPVEAWGRAGDVPGFEAYTNQHAGNPITEIRTGGGLADEIKAELEAINDLDKQAKGYADGATQAAACIARGMAGGTT